MGDSKNFVLSKIWDRGMHGFLFGAGLGVSLFLLFIAADKIDDEIDSREQNRKTTTLEIIDHSDGSTPEKYIVLGTLKNVSKDPVKSVTLEAEFFMDGKFVDECSDSASIYLKVDGEENVKLSCKNCNEEIYPEHNSYTLKVINTY